VLLRNPFVQVLPLEVCEFSGKKPAIAFNVLLMAPHFGGMEVDHPPSPPRLGVGGASVIGSGILETAIRLQHVSATVRQLSRGELAGRAFKPLDHDEASDFASEKSV
jgi:hypothetical protein